MPESGAVVGHGVGDAGDVVELGEIAVVTLMEGKETEEVSRGAVCGNGAPAVPMDGGGVVGEGRGGGVATISQKGEDVLMGEGAG